MRLCGGIEKWWFLSFSSSLFRSVSPILFLARCPSKPGSPCVLSYPYLHSLYFERSIYYFLNNYILFLPSLSLALAHSLPSSLPFLLSSSFILSLSFPPSPSLLSLSFSPSPSLPPSRLFRPPPPSSAPRLHLGSSLMYPLFVSTKPLYHAARSRIRRRRQKRVTGSHQVSKGANFYLERRERLIGSKTSREGLQGRQHAGYREGGSGRRRGANERQIF